MHPLIAGLANGIVLGGGLPADVGRFLTHYGCAATLAHSRAVAGEARCIAQRCGLHVRAAERGGWLHDVSAVVPPARRLSVAQALGLEVLAEEAAFPLILHQKLSAVLARELFGVREEALLQAIGCHTTLRAGAGPLDMAVFVADKLAWDRPGRPPYLEAVRSALESSLERAAAAYLCYVWQRRGELAVIHPWFREAYAELSDENRYAPAGGRPLAT